MHVRIFSPCTTGKARAGLYRTSLSSSREYLPSFASSMRSAHTVSRRLSSKSRLPCRRG